MNLKFKFEFSKVTDIFEIWKFEFKYLKFHIFSYIFFFFWYSLSDRGPGQWKHQYLCVIRSGSAIFRYFLRQKVTVIFEILKFWNFEILTIWTQTPPITFPMSLVTRMTQKPVLRIKNIPKIDVFSVFFTKSRSASGFISKNKNFKMLYLKN